VNATAAREPRIRALVQLKRFIVHAVGIALLSTSALAQLPPSRLLTLDVAETIAREALARCRAEGLRATVIVVDALNMPKVMIRDDGATASTTEVAKMKATTTMLYDRASGPLRPLPAGAGTPPASMPGTVNAQGGVPIKVGDVTIGAVAISATPGGAGTSGKDTACAQAGIAKVADRLR
jgi:uncharacterized protein GlcG (DUF336 family)